MVESQIEYNYSALARTARQSERHAHHCRAVLSSQRIPHREVTIRDASDFGLGGRGAMLVPGEHLRVFVDKIGDFDAVVKWARGDSFGLQVDRQVDIALLRQAEEDMAIADAAFAQAAFADSNITPLMSWKS
ncbi:hypothetical protein D5I55_12110 [Chakrabartia godavariana]|nr:hypothetical protein D5I55_12110 [Chakrabartia godavariana]